MRSSYLLLIVIFSCESFAMESWLREIKTKVEKKVQRNVARQPKIEAKKEIADGDLCPICLTEDTSNIDKNFNIVSLGCHKNHKFCTECISESQKNKPECPICRGSMAPGTKMKIEMYNILRVNPSITQRDILLAIGVAELRTNKYAGEESILLKNTLRNLTTERDNLKAIKSSYETEYAALQKKYELVTKERDKLVKENFNLRQNENIKSEKAFKSGILFGVVGTLTAVSVGYYIAKKYNV